MTFHSTSLSNPTRPCPAHQECALKLGEPTYPVKIDRRTVAPRESAKLGVGAEVPAMYWTENAPGPLCP